MKKRTKKLFSHLRASAAICFSAVDQLRDIATRHMMVGYCAVPDLLRDRLGLAAVAIEQIPDRLLADFPRVVAGL